jgi:pimeloyl-ACP methyl ester carboxylesterase
MATGRCLPLLVGLLLSATFSHADEVPNERELKGLKEQIDRLRSTAKLKPDALADVEVFVRGLAWALRYETQFEPADQALLKKALARGKDRLAALEANKQPWADRKGRVARGYVSAVDGSVQPYGVIIPAKYDRAKPIRLDVVLHGSTRPVGLSELRFLNRFDDGDEGGKAPEQDFIELHPLGRVENCYRWAGETDVFEAIEAVCRNYNIDRDRIVLRGMSMGASGTWHLGLKHPDRFVALGPYCGYVDTHQFSETPLSTFVKVGPLPAHQEKALHMLDSVDYAANAGVVPAIACMGEKDVFFQAHVIMGKAMEKEGLKMVNLISPGTGHVIDPVTHREQMKRIGEYAEKGLDHHPKHIRFVTWTLKYNRCHWLQVLGLGEHYARGELDATVAADGSVEMKEPVNVTRFALLPPVLQAPTLRLSIGGKPVAIPVREGIYPPRKTVVEKRGGQWVYLGELDTVKVEGKRPGLQGPIDDAFTTPFLCVRGTGKPWNPAVQAWADASLKRFADEWHHYLRGDLPIKDDTAVTEEDVKRCNLILFGDPGSNPWINKVLPQMPIRWTKDELQVGKERYAARDHSPVLIQPNPLANGRYVVLNSGHTFHEKELASLNYLLFPRLGDWAVMKIGEKNDETVLRAGFFDEQWQISDPAPPAPDPDRVRIASDVSGHIHPAACVTKRGTVVVIYGKADMKDLHLTRSTDGGRTWSKPTLYGPTEKLSIYPGSLTALKDGRIVHVWNVWYTDAKGKKSRYPQYSISDDEGKTWSEPRSLPKNPDSESVNRHPIIELGPREWLFSLTDKTILYDPQTEKVTPLGDGRNHGLVPIVRTPKGTLVSGLGLRSTDQGKTWVKVEPFPRVGENGWRFDLAVLSNGWLITSEVLGPGTGGNYWRFVVSRDDGKSWDFDNTYQFYNPGRPIGGRACPKTVQLDRDTIGTVYYDVDAKQPGGPGVFFVRTPIAKLATSRP